jgi:hypothetical protein
VKCLSSANLVSFIITVRLLASTASVTSTSLLALAGNIEADLDKLVRFARTNADDGGRVEFNGNFVLAGDIRVGDLVKRKLKCCFVLDVKDEVVVLTLVEEQYS